MQVVDESTPAQVEEILAYATVAGTSALPPANMREGMFHCHPLTQAGPSLRGLLTLSQFDEQGFLWMNTDTAPPDARGTLGSQGTVGAGFLRKVDDSTKHKGHLLPGWTANNLLVPIQGKRLLGKALTRVNRPGFTIDF